MRVLAHLWLAVFVCVQLQAMQQQCFLLPPPEGSRLVRVGAGLFALEPAVVSMLQTLQNSETVACQLASDQQRPLTCDLVDWRTFGSIVAGVRASLGDGDYGQRVTNARAALQAHWPLEQLPFLLEGLNVLAVPPQTSFGTAVVLHCAHAWPEIGGCLGRSYDELSPSMQSVLRYGAHALLNDMLCHALREPGFTVDDPPSSLLPLAQKILKNKTPRAPEKIQSLLCKKGDRRFLHCVPGVCALTELRLYNNNLSTLPPEIGALVNLRELWLYNNKLSALPPEIGALVNLQELWLSFNELKILPPEIGALVNLRELWLSNNELRTLPPQIGALVNLRELGLSSNELSTLPPEIGTLVNLWQLSLSNNKLRTLPPQIGTLVSLQKLLLYNNKFSTLPPQIGALVKLRVLLIGGNRFTPDSITSIRNALSPHCVIYAGGQRTSN